MLHCCNTLRYADWPDMLASVTTAATQTSIEYVQRTAQQTSCSFQRLSVVHWNGSSNYRPTRPPGNVAVAYMLPSAQSDTPCRQLEALLARIPSSMPAQLWVRVSRLQVVVKPDVVRCAVHKYVLPRAKRFGQQCTAMMTSMVNLLEAIQLRKAQAARCAARAPRKPPPTDSARSSLRPSQTFADDRLLPSCRRLQKENMLSLDDVLLKVLLSRMKRGVDDGARQYGGALRRTPHVAQQSRLQPSTCCEFAGQGQGCHGQATIDELTCLSAIVEQMTRGAEEKRLAEAAAIEADLLNAEKQEADKKQAKKAKMERQRAAKMAEAARKVTSFPWTVPRGKDTHEHEGHGLGHHA